MGRGRCDPSLRLAGFTALAIVASGPTPRRARLVGLVALHVDAGEVAERFAITLNPGVRVPRYALVRLGLELEALETCPPLPTSLDDLVRFLGNRAVLAQDVASPGSSSPPKRAGCSASSFSPRCSTSTPWRTPA